MEIRKVNAIIRTDKLEPIETRLETLGVCELSTTRVTGCGEYANFFARDPRTPHVRIEIFAEKERAEQIVRAILEVAHTGECGDGLVALLPVERIWRIRTGHEATAEQLA